jgi:hypothetical protein
VAVDFAIVGVVGAIAFGVLKSEAMGAGFLCACLWLALNTVLLSRLLETITIGQRPGLALLFACAKIPLSYLILYWLFQAPYLDAGGLTVGILTLPAVLAFRGSIVRRKTHVIEEGR